MQIIYHNKSEGGFKTITNVIKFDIKTAFQYFEVKARRYLNKSDYSLLPSWILEGTFSE